MLRVFLLYYFPQIFTKKSTDIHRFLRKEFLAFTIVHLSLTSILPNTRPTQLLSPDRPEK